jgi:hypothetical protein
MSNTDEAIRKNSQKPPTVLKMHTLRASGPIDKKTAGRALTHPRDLTAGVDEGNACRRRS